MVTPSLAPARLPPDERIYAIGDIHGCRDQLDDLHRQIAADLAARPVADATIIHLGDYIDRGPETLRRQQSTISLQIQRLETALGQKLIERTPRSVRLTSDGETFLGYARRLLDLNDEVVARVGEPQMHGTVRLGTPEDF
eukprot:gene32698-43701_t